MNETSLRTEGLKAVERDLALPKNQSLADQLNKVEAHLHKLTTEGEAAKQVLSDIQRMLNSIQITLGIHR